MCTKKAHTGRVDFAFTNYLSRFAYKDTTLSIDVKHFFQFFL